MPLAYEGKYLSLKMNYLSSERFIIYLQNKISAKLRYFCLVDNRNSTSIFHSFNVIAKNINTITDICFRASY